MKYRVLVFPCGSECGLEIGRALGGLKEIEMWGGSSVHDHGRFAFENYVGNLPFVSDKGFIDAINATISSLGIDFIYPAMDSVVSTLCAAQEQLHAKVVGPSKDVAEIAFSKRKTYDVLTGVVPARSYTISRTFQLMIFPCF